jgi:hypothetical protein
VMEAFSICSMYFCIYAKHRVYRRPYDRTWTSSYIAVLNAILFLTTIVIGCWFTHGERRRLEIGGTGFCRQ